MMVGGIVITSLTPIAMIAAMVGAVEKTECQSRVVDYGSGDSTSYRTSSCSKYDTTIYGSLLLMTAMLGVGIPMIVVGAKREPARPAAVVTPWVSPSTAGLALRLNL